MIDFSRTLRMGTSSENSKVIGVALKGGVSTLALCIVSIASPAWAAGETPAAAKAPDSVAGAPIAPATSGQTTTDTPPTGEVNSADIVVTGIRQSLKTAQALKQNSDVVSDSISSEDIGALPDRSVTEALQRVPGVSISRFAAGSDPDHFSVEGSGVVVRGLTYTRSELNGRDSFTANNGRGLSFADVPAELLGGVDVFKSPSADMIEGGIAGTVNLRTRLPFDQKGLLVAGTGEINYGDLTSKSAPTVSLLASDRWSTGIGEIGLLASFVRSEIHSRADGLQLSNYGLRGLTAGGSIIAPNDPAATRQVYIPRGAALREQDYDRTRYGYSAAAQWRSNDGSMAATFQFLRSDSRETMNEHAVEIATDVVTGNGDTRPVAGTTFNFGSDGVFTDGTLTAPQGYRDDQWTGNSANNHTPLEALQSNNATRVSRQRFQTNDYGANFRWNVTDRFKATFDYQHVASRVTNVDLSTFVSAFQNVEIHTKGSKQLPIIKFIPIDQAANAGTFYNTSAHQSYTDPYSSFYRSFMDHVEDSDGYENAARVDLEYSFPADSWLTSVKAGYRFADRENHARYSTYNWGVVSEIWGGGGPVWLDDPVNGNPAAGGGSPGPSEAFEFANFFRGAANNPIPDGRLFVPSSVVGSQAAFNAAGLAIGDEWRARNGGNGCQQNWVPLAQRCNVIAGTPFLPSEINPVSEKNNAAYGEIRFGNTFGGGIKLTGNVGVRYTETTRVSSGLLQYPSFTPPTVADCTPGIVPGSSPPQQKVIPVFCTLPAAEQQRAIAFGNSGTMPITGTAKYHYWLPSLNLKLVVGHGLQFRAAFNKSITPPDFGLTRAYYNITLDTTDVTLNNPIYNRLPQGATQVGNPFLKPVRGENYDLTAEWYFSSVGQLTISLFKKDLHDVLTNGTFHQNYTNNGATYDIVTTTPVNSKQTGRIKGFEVGYQQVYSFLPGFLKGFGMNANFTYVQSKGVAQSTLSNTDPNVSAGVIANIDTSKLPLQGLSKYTVNITPFYQYGPLEIRAAYSWRSKYLLTVRDVIVPFAPIMNESTGQLDASIFVAVNDHVKMGLQATNLLNETLRTSQVINNNLLTEPRSWFINDRRFTFSIRAKFGG
ncbi:MAG: TonB-dependent receptor [Sphingomonas bacterium]